MTLVIAHKMGNHISLSSDSRISFGAAGHIDYVIKVFCVPVKIYSPTRAGTNTANVVYNHNLGLAITGSAINAYTVKESVYEMLLYLQYIPGHTALFNGWHRLLDIQGIHEIEDGPREYHARKRDQ